MGGSSPHCPGTGNIGKDEVAGRTAFGGASSRLDLSSRGYASKRLPQAGSRNGNISQLVLNTRAHGQKAAKREWGECFPVKGKVLAYRILIAAVLLWLVFQTALLLQGIVVKHSDIDLAIGMPWNERLQRMSQSLINTSVVLKRSSTVEIEKQRNWSTFRPPKLALVCPHLGAGPDSIFLVTLARGLQLLGYRLELYALKTGALRYVWDRMNVSVNIFGTEAGSVDWSMFDGVVAVSLYSKFVFPSLVVEPFRSIPLIWIIQDSQLVKSLKETTGQTKLSWRHAFQRAKLVVFSNEDLLNVCAHYDTGNFHVVPGSPVEVWEAEQCINLNSRPSIRARYGLDVRDFAVAVGSLNSNGAWKAHAMLMHAVAKQVDRKPDGQLKLFVLGHGSHGNYSIALKAMASQFGILNTSVHYVGDENLNEVVWAADVLAYVSVSDERFFPPVLIRALAFGQLVFAPASDIIRKYIADGVNGYLYPAGDYDALWTRLLAVWQSRPFNRIAPAAKLSARNLLADEALTGYVQVLQSNLEFPSEVSIPDGTRLPKLAWEWTLFENKSAEEIQLDNIGGPKDATYASADDNSSLENRDYEGILEDEISQEKIQQLVEDVERVEDEELEERKEQAQATFEDVNRGVKRAEREKFEFHERDDGELERTGQPLCIYEPYYGSGAWLFLHQNVPLYRGLSLSPKGRRPRADDVDAAARLPLLNDTYYRDNLCEFGAFLAIANRIDRVHKNSWIGFQPWTAAARKVALSERAEISLVEAVRVGTHGDAVYFWGRINGDIHEFWSSCDARNAGNCRRIFSETLRTMYGVGDTVIELPPMPLGVWGSLHCWAMSTASFMEFVMFSRMFLDALDARLYVEHHDFGKCSLATTKLECQHCYCRLLEVLVNVWAYHSGRKLIYVDPRTGTMMEQAPLESRHGLMNVKWFSFAILKGMDEDMAERADDERPNHRWLWPHTGEVFWQGILERERQERYNLKMERKRRNKERLARMRSRYKQKSLGRYVKPAPGAGYVEIDAVNTTSTE